MSIALVVFTDGRWDVLEQTLVSAAENLYGDITHTMLVVDGIHPDEPVNRAVGQLSQAFPRAHLFTMIHGERIGFGKTIQRAWAALPSFAPECRFVFHLEDDFLINQPVDLPQMMALLDTNPHLVQISLKRQPWNDLEIAAGDFVALNPDDYEEHSSVLAGGGLLPPVQSVTWLEQRRFFTTNPSLYRRGLCDLGWPGDLEHSEGRFSHRLMENPDVKFGILGRKFDPPRVTHIGAHRIGTGY